MAWLPNRETINSCIIYRPYTTTSCGAHSFSACRVTLSRSRFIPPELRNFRYEKKRKKILRRLDSLSSREQDDERCDDDPVFRDLPVFLGAETCLPVRHCQVIPFLPIPPLLVVRFLFASNICRAFSFLQDLQLLTRNGTCSITSMAVGFCLPWTHPMSVLFVNPLPLQCGIDLLLAFLLLLCLLLAWLHLIRRLGIHGRTLP